MRRFLTLPWSCFLLVCCDNPATSDVRKDDDSPATPASRGGHAPRKQTPGTPAALRTTFETACKIESPETREKAIAEVAWNALEIDPDLACEALQKMSSGSTGKIRLIQHYAMRLAEQNPDEALAWAETLGTEQEIAAAKGHIALAVAETDPHRAANLLSESGIIGRDFDVAVVQVIQRWAAQSPPDAAAWVTLFPPGPAREAGIKVIAEQWLPRDAPTAFEWLDTLQDETLRRETVRAMEGVILQQPQDIRDGWLQHADDRTRNELEQQRANAIRDVGENLPQFTK